jgi:RNA recognition motif-containing protein
MINLCIRGLPKSTTEEVLSEMFSEFGTVRSMKLLKDMFSGECKGIAFVGMEGHEARAAVAGLDGKDLNGSSLRVGPDRPSTKRKGRSRR